RLLDPSRSQRGRQRALPHHRYDTTIPAYLRFGLTRRLLTAARTLRWSCCASIRWFPRSGSWSQPVSRRRSNTFARWLTHLPRHSTTTRPVQSRRRKTESQGDGNPPPQGADKGGYEVVGGRGRDGTRCL